MPQAITYPVRFTFSYHQHVSLYLFSRSNQVPTPHTAATAPAIMIDREVLTMRLP